MADRTRKHAWEATPLGSIEGWPYELVSTVNLLLASKFPMFLWWGPELIQFYNDAYRPSMGEDKHPRALGQRGKECWEEIWPIIGPEIDRVRRLGEAIWNVNKLVPIFRNGSIEEVFWTYSYSPVRDGDGLVNGVLVTCHETTEQVVNERRLRTLLAIEREVGAAESLDQLANQIVQTLASNRADIPFAALYCVDDGKTRLVGQTGLERDALEMAEQLPIMEVARSKQPKLVDDMRERAGGLICEPWPEEIKAAFIQPSGSILQLQYVLVLGTSPRLTFDSNYASFFQLAGNRICGLIESEGHQEERRLVESQRKQLFETVDEQHELLANIVNNAPAGIIVLDSELRVKWCNPYFVTLLDAQWNIENLIGEKLFDAVPRAEEIIRILERVRGTHEPFVSTEYEHVGFARGVTYWRWSVIQLATGDILVVSSEVTEQVVARRKLERVGERLHLAQRAARLGMYHWHPPSGNVEWSPEFCEVAGFSVDQRADWGFYLSQVHSNDRERLRRELLDTMEAQNELLQIHDHRLVDAQGRERWVALTGHIHRDASGAVERIVGSGADITQRKNAEKELKESRKEVQQQWAELEALYRTAPIGLALFDPVEFRYLRLNRRQAEMTGLPPEKILGKTLTEVAPIKGLREMLERVAQGMPVINELLEGELPMNPGEHRYWTVNYLPVYDADGSIQAISAASLEITAQKRAELALIQSEKIAAVGRLASSISHEINNPLEAVTNLLYLLRHENLSRAGREYLESAEQELARVSQIATHTLRFHRQSTKAMETGAAEMLEPIVMLHMSRMNSSGIKVEKEYRTDSKVVCFDGEIRQVLNNLVGNAVDAMWRGGRLRLRSQIATDWLDERKTLRITIADTGEGMNEMTKRRLFEAFFTTKGIKGTGLGLWISSEIACKHGGRLRFRSSRKEGGSGTVFQLFLPLQSATLEQTVRNNQIDGRSQKAV
ncbi:MAG TPA: PAS domain-containing protein [Candidatus Saccharimonadales bacterium]|nr:PAS domain-containing protein [Candidatus Saccharimonadales bacterium]